MELAMVEAIPADVKLLVKGSLNQRMFLLARYALKSYMKLSIEAIAYALSEECREVLTSADSGVAAKSFARNRVRTLKKWRDDTMPLTSGASSTSIVNLLLTLQKDAEADPVIELPRGDPPELSITQFAQDFLRLGRATSPASSRKIRFPWPRGQLPRLIKSMLEKVEDKLLDRHENAEDTLTPLIESAVQSLGIAFIPGRVTARTSTLDPYAWTVLSKRSAARPGELTLSKDQKRMRLVSDGANKAGLSQPQAKWSIADVGAFHASKLAYTKDVLPEEFVASASVLLKKPTIPEEMKHFANTFDLRKPLHRFALLAGIVMHTIHPDLSFLSGTWLNVPENQDDNEVWLKNQPWVDASMAQSNRSEVNKGKGTNNPADYVLYGAILFLLLYDESSPLDFNSSTPLGPVNQKFSKRLKSLDVLRACPNELFLSGKKLQDLNAGPYGPR
jgi:hypothetical protein